MAFVVRDTTVTRKIGIGCPVLATTEVCCCVGLGTCARTLPSVRKTRMDPFIETSPSNEKVQTSGRCEVSHIWRTLGPFRTRGRGPVRFRRLTVHKNTHQIKSRDL